MLRTAFALLLAINLAALTIGERPKSVEISGDEGGVVVGNKRWSSSMLQEKLYVLFYVDPDERKTNEHVSKALKKEKFDHSKFGSVAIINAAATWKPDYVIQKLLEIKQKEFSNTLFVMDRASVLVKAWGLEDDASNVLLFDKDGRLLFYKSGRLSDGELKNLIELIRAKIDEERV